MTPQRILLWLAATLAVGLAGRFQTYHARSDRCALDGTRIVSVYAVELMTESRVLHRFCSLTCASEWPDVPAGSYWRVHDEVSGEPIDASVARFVESSVVSVPARQCRLHAFRTTRDALEHAEQYSGAAVPSPLPPPTQKETSP